MKETRRAAHLPIEEVGFALATAMCELIRRTQMELKDFFPLVSGFAIVIVGFFVTKRVTEASKRTDIFLGFTQRFHKLFSDVNEANASFAKQRDSVGRSRMDDLYRQFFGLMFDEFMAYRYNFLDRDVFVEWMYSRMHDARENETPPFKIGYVPYMKAWSDWSAQPAIADHDFVKFLNRIHDACSSRDDVRRTVLAYDPSMLRRALEKIRSPHWPTELILGFLMATAGFAVLRTLNWV